MSLLCCCFGRLSTGLYGKHVISTVYTLMYAQSVCLAIWFNKGKNVAELKRIKPNGVIYIQIKTANKKTKGSSIFTIFPIKLKLPYNNISKMKLLNPEPRFTSGMSIIKHLVLYSLLSALLPVSSLFLSQPKKFNRGAPIRDINLKFWG